MEFVRWQGGTSSIFEKVEIKMHKLGLDVNKNVVTKEFKNSAVNGRKSSHFSQSRNFMHVHPLAFDHHLNFKFTTIIFV